MTDASGCHKHAADMQAASKHEDAAVLYGQLLAEGTPGIGQQKQLRGLLMDCCCEAYSAVSDWEGLQQWLQDVKVRSTSVRSSSAQEMCFWTCQDPVL